MPTGRPAQDTRTSGVRMAVVCLAVVCAAVLPIAAAFGLRAFGPNVRAAEPVFTPAPLAAGLTRVIADGTRVRVVSAEAAAGLAQPPGWRVITSDRTAPIRLIFAAPDTADGPACVLIAADLRTDRSAAVSDAPIPPGCDATAQADTAGRRVVQAEDAVWVFTLVAPPEAFARYRAVVDALAASAGAAP